MTFELSFDKDDGVVYPVDEEEDIWYIEEPYGYVLNLKTDSDENIKIHSIGVQYELNYYGQDNTALVPSPLEAVTIEIDVMPCIIQEYIG